ncbi:MAG: hypothetical protein KatS3mg009_2344 [Acidimicrobiia bacterium]|nr:MAG: hypothetical protein KatS3mg009_2344 [Acidimicrobiia bacterium]
MQRRPDGGGALVGIVVKEGRKRMVRRMLAAVGHPVVRLVRTRIGPLTDRRLAPGSWRPLEPSEVRALYAAALGRAEPTSRLTCPPVKLLALRGAITCDADTKEEIDAKTQRLVREMLERNDVAHDDIVSVIFTATDDLTAEFPAAAARAIGLGRRPAAVRPRAGGLARRCRAASACSCTSRTPPAAATGARCTTSTSTARARCATTSRSSAMGRVAVIGTGLVGGSVGLGLARRGHEVAGHDRDRARLDRAKEIGAVTTVAAASAEACAGRRWWSCRCRSAPWPASSARRSTRGRRS